MWPMSTRPAIARIVVAVCLVIPCCGADPDPKTIPFLSHALTLCTHEALIRDDVSVSKILNEFKQGLCESERRSVVSAGRLYERGEFRCRPLLIDRRKTATSPLMSLLRGLARNAGRGTLFVVPTFYTACVDTSYVLDGDLSGVFLRPKPDKGASARDEIFACLTDGFEAYVHRGSIVSLVSAHELLHALLEVLRLPNDHPDADPLFRAVELATSQISLDPSGRPCNPDD